MKDGQERATTIKSIGNSVRNAESVFNNERGMLKISYPRRVLGRHFTLTTEMFKSIKIGINNKFFVEQVMPPMFYSTDQLHKFPRHKYYNGNVHRPISH